MSPNAREGFYIVIHFAADGSAVFLTLGCGSTIWAGGDLKAISDDELTMRTSWARSVVYEKWQTLEPFADQMELGARAPLPRTFEKATALAKRFSITELNDADFRRVLVLSAERLAEIYRAQHLGRDMSPADEETAEIIAILRPRKTRAVRQGFKLTGGERRAVETRAMDLVKEWLETNGFEWKDHSSSESYDLHATKGASEYKVEVKGTTSDICESILMTKNEVDLHRREKGKTALAIVSRIRLHRQENPVYATGGKLEMLWQWDIDDWVRKAIVFQLTRSSK